MKKRLTFATILVLALFIASIGFAQEDVKKYPSCKYCGMDREKFAHSRILIEYEDGTAEGMCSLHCAAIDLAINIDKTPKAIKVGDYDKKSLVEVEKAFWIVGGNKMGVMSKRAKWAFETKEDAEKFKTANGGELATFDQAIRASYDDMYQDTKMIREKRKMRKMEKQHKM